ARNAGTSNADVAAAAWRHDKRAGGTVAAIRRTPSAARRIQRSWSGSGALDGGAAARRAAQREYAETRTDARDRRRKVAVHAGATARRIVQAGIRSPGSGAQRSWRNADARRGRRRSQESADQRQKPRRLGRGAIGSVVARDADAFPVR